MTAPTIAISDELLTQLDHFGPLPMWFQVAQILADAIAAGVIPVASQLESEARFAERLRISRPTMRRAMQELVDRGLVVRRRGIGTQVVRRTPPQSGLTSLYGDLLAAGRTPSTTVVSVERVPADTAVAEALEVPDGAEVVQIERIRAADGVPVAVLVNWLPGRTPAPTADELKSRGLYELLRARRVELQYAEERISGRTASPREAALLQVGPGSQLLTMTRLVRDASFTVVEWGTHCWLPDRYVYATTTTALAAGRLIIRS